MFQETGYQISKSYHEVLMKYNAFYRELSPNYQREFRGRVREFINSKEFRGGYETRLKHNQLVAVSGAAIQVTFGLRNYLLESFETIIIYPEMYQSTLTGHFHKGEVNPQHGVIVISWKDFEFGNQDDHDKMNVGLHEMGHAFYFNTHILRDEIVTTYDFLSKFLFLSEEEIVRIRQNHSTLFRKYAGENAAEFFAIAVEYFFEAPLEFSQKLPELYRYMCLVLRMDINRKIYRNLDFSDYFNQQNFDDFNFKKETILLDAHKTGYHIHFEAGRMIMAYQAVLTFIGLIFLMLISPLLTILIFGISAVLFYFFYKLFYKQKVEASANYLIVHRQGFTEKRIQGIHFDNILSVDLGADDSTLFIRYFNNSSLHSLYIGRPMFQDKNVLLLFLAKRNIMLKNNGQRISRIKSHRFWR